MSVWIFIYLSVSTTLYVYMSLNIVILIAVVSPHLHIIWAAHWCLRQLGHINCRMLFWRKIQQLEDIYKYSWLDSKHRHAHNCHTPPTIMLLLGDILHFSTSDESSIGGPHKSYLSVAVPFHILIYLNHSLYWSIDLYISNRGTFLTFFLPHKLNINRQTDRHACTYVRTHAHTHNDSHLDNFYDDNSTKCVSAVLISRLVTSGRRVAILAFEPKPARKLCYTLPTTLEKQIIVEML